MYSTIQSVRQHARVQAERLGLLNQSPRTGGLHLDACINWLCLAQDATADGGVSQTYLVRSGHWANSYPETTGYIIPTFYSYASLRGRDDIRARARRMLDWECEIQLPDGGVVAGAWGDGIQFTDRHGRSRDQIALYRSMFSPAFRVTMAFFQLPVLPRRMLRLV